MVNNMAFSLVLLIIAVLSVAKNLDPIYWGCKSLNREVVMTYDDGPSPKTDQLLDMLNLNQVKATFFVVGLNVVQYPKVIQRMVREGHTVGSHTWSHKNLTALLDPESSSYNPAQFYYEISHTEEVLYNLTGQIPKFFRPPYGAINEEIKLYLEKLGYTIIMWNIGCLDWYFQNGTVENTIYLSGMSDAGAIICLHDNKYPDFVQSNSDLIAMMRSTTPLPFANPQGRNIVDISKCL